MNSAQSSALSPAPHFAELGLVPELLRAVEGAGYTSPTPIQLQAIPLALSGSDVLGLAQTGTGKTAAFALPLLQHLGKGSKQRPRILVLVPTRELAQQVHAAFTAFGAPLGIRSCSVIGGVSAGPQLAQFRRGVDVLIACPGRLLDHLQQRAVDLRDIRHLVLDEADHMFDMGFLPDVRRIIKALPAERQNLFFSATMPPEIRRLALEILREPKTVEISRGAAAHTVSHALYPVKTHRKTELAIAYLKSIDSDSVLVFARTKHRAKKLAHDLTTRGFAATSLQGNLSQTARQRAMEGFRSGAYQVLVATDIAARGIDVSSITHVVNFDVPQTPDTYVHRIGRTGRAARTGDAITFVTPEDTQQVRAIERRLNQAIERRTLPGFDYEQAPATQSSRDSSVSRRDDGREPMQRDGRRHTGNTARPQRRNPSRNNSGGGSRGESRGGSAEGSSPNMERGSRGGGGRNRWRNGRRSSGAASGGRYQGGDSGRSPSPKSYS